MTDLVIVKPLISFSGKPIVE